MSERINVDHAFDPEARKAQAELDAYLESRPYQDENGMLREAGSNKFTNKEKIDAAHDAAREDHYEQTLSAEDYSNESLEQLARRVADARAEGDKTRAIDAEDAFFEKFTAMSEKYGWDEDDDSVNDTLRVDKDAKIGRTTVDDRLARYSKIMYGEDAAEQPAVAAESKVDTPAAEEAAVEADAKEEPVEAEPAAGKPEAFNVDTEAEQAKGRLAKRAEELEQEANAKRADSESAKADRELLARVSKEGLEDPEEATPIAKVSKEGLESDDEEAGKIARVSKEGLEDFEDDEVEPAKPAKNFLGRARKALDKARDLYLRAAFEVGHTVDLAKQELSKRGGRKEGETEEQYERRMRRNGRNIALGIVALAGASIAAKAGAFDGLFDGNGPATGTGSAEAATDTNTGGDRVKTIDDSNLRYSAEAHRIDNGEGLFQTFEEMGIPKDKWQAVLDQSGPKLVRMGEAYSDPSIGGYGLNGDGRLSERALKVIADSARNVK